MSEIKQQHAQIIDLDVKAQKLHQMIKDEKETGK
jgi:hypothetical protein